MPNKRKVLFVLPSLRAGGSERVITQIAKYLDKSKFLVFVLVIDSKDAFYTFDSLDKVSVIRLRVNKIRYSFIHLFKVIWKIKPNVIFSTITHLNTYLCLLKPIILSNSIIVIRESNVLRSFVNYRSYSKNRMVFLLMKKAYRNADTIVCQSLHMQKEIGDMLSIDMDKTVVINNPVSEVEPGLKLENQPFDIIAVGSLSQIKGYDRMLEAFTLLDDKKVKLGIIGDGKLRGFLNDEIKRLGLENRVSLIGKIKNPSIYLQNAKMLLITSYFEAFPNVVLEAGMAGIPVVGFKVPGGISEIISNGRNGYLVKDGDLETLKSKIEITLNSNFDSKKIVEETKERFGMDQIINQYEVLFERLIGGAKK